MEPIRVYDNPPRDAWPALTARITRDDAEIDRRVAAILNEVRTGGDEALRRIARRIEGFAPERFELPQAQLDEAARNISPELKTALATAKANIEAFHRAQLPRPVAVEVMPGVRCSQRAVAIRRVGLYVPGGSAPLFSTVLMLAVPAAIAGCAEIVLCTPAGRDGSIAPEIRYAAALCGVRRVFALGGAQAVAAMAYGTESVPRVDKIFGPGNRYVTRAKQLVGAEGTAIDLPAGPSEVLVLADEGASPDFAAADLLSQAEHGADQALDKRVGAHGNHHGQAHQSDGKILPAAEAQGHLSQLRGNAHQSDCREGAADEGAEHADGQSLGRLALLRHGIAVKAGGNGRGRTGDADEHRRDKGTGHAADPDGKQHDKGSLGGKTKGDGQQQSDAQGSGQTRDCTKDDA